MSVLRDFFQKLMFSQTLKSAESLLDVIRCDHCREPSDNLQFIGSSCKHVFCWTCVNILCNEAYFPKCPLCSLPIGSSHVQPAYFANQIFQELLKLEQNIRKIKAPEIDKGAALALFADDQRRTAEDFCAAQILSSEENRHCDEVNCNNLDKSDVKQLAEKQVRREHTDDLPLAPLPANVTPFTQQVEYSSSAEAVQFQMTQHVSEYRQPESYHFFERLPARTFSNGAAISSGGKKRKFEGNFVKNDQRRCKTIRNVTPVAKNSPRQTNKCNLINAAIRGQKSRLLEALKDGEDANDRDNLGFTALYHAAARNFVEICEILVENGALVDAHGGDLCETALHAAVKWHALGATRYLLSRGANRLAPNLKGETALDLSEDEEVRKIFESSSQFVEIEADLYPLEYGWKFSLLERKSAEFSEFFSRGENALALETATHMVVVTKDLAAELTEEVLEAMLRGLYIVSGEWLRMCCKKNDIIGEEEFEMNSITRFGNVIAEGATRKARKNNMEMKPGLFRGCHFYFCLHKYFPPFRINILKKLVLLGEGVLLGREPCSVEYIDLGIRPFHIQTSGHQESQVGGLFAVYMPGQTMPRRILKDQFINLVTPLWIYDCIAKFALVRPDDR